jgi:hypothetical protein
MPQLTQFGRTTVMGQYRRRHTSNNTMSNHPALWDDKPDLIRRNVFFFPEHLDMLAGGAV